MNIKRAQPEIKDTIEAYLLKDRYGAYEIPAIRQRPVVLIGPPGVGKNQIMEQISQECRIGLVAYTRRKKGVPSARQAEAVCLAYIVLIMTFITIITVFPYPGRPAIFFSLFCLLMKQNLNIKRRILFIGCIFMLCFLVVLFVAIRVVLI